MLPLLPWIMLLVLPALCHGAQQSWGDRFFLDVGGHLRTTGTVQDSTLEALRQADGRDSFQDLTLETRLKLNLKLGSGLDFTTHYQAWLETGDQTRQELQGISSLGAFQTLFPGSTAGDSLRFLDLTRTVSRHGDTRIIHRLDRLKLTLSRPWGRISLGRQALTLGNGLIFNPMDFFNPFSPTALLRDYKTGDDMALLQFGLDSGSDMRFFHLPRRDPAGREVSWNRSSTGGTGHFFAGSIELDLLAARHYEDRVLGLGLSGSLRSSAWRLDLTWTDLNHDSTEADFLSAVANLDRSWVWWDKNWYGLVEIFFSGVGESDLSKILTNEDLLERINRGELFVLGRSYLAGLIRLEAHPLVNISGTVIANLEDTSWLFQPKVTWNLAQNMDLLLGATLAQGPSDSEFGGFDVQLGLQEATLSPQNSVALWLTVYF